MKIDRILVGVDGSDNAHRAVEWTAGVAQLVGAKVIAVHAVGLRDQPDRAEAAEGLNGEWSHALRAAGTDHECIMRDGNSVTVVLDAAAEFGVDLIVLGSRGLGGYPELLLGSTSTQVAQRSTAPVVIVPSGRALDVEV